MSTLTVLTQNIWGGFPRWRERCELLADRLAKLAPEVACMQEVHGTADDSQAHEIAERVGGYTVHFAPARTYEDRAEGLALLVRHDANVHDPLALTLDPSDRFEGRNQRMVLAATIDHPEGPVDVFVTHLSLSRHARTRTAAELLTFVRELHERTGSIAAVVGGDLNADPTEEAVEVLEAQLTDAWRAAHGTDRGGTWPAIFPFRRIDYVFVRGDAASVESCRRVPYSGSDHLGLMARIRLVHASGRRAA
jgi:endonuclease/exonuclease/phosphatase family metal-dependent hydrolase